MRSILFNFIVRCGTALSGHRLMVRFPFLRPFEKIYRNLYKATHPDVILIEKRKLFLDQNDNLDLAKVGESYELPTTEVFKSQVRAGDTVVDIGANIGYFTLLAALRVGPQGKVIAFEPNPEFTEALQKTLDANPDLKVTSVQKAVAEASEKNATFFLPGVLTTSELKEKVSSEIGAHKEAQVEVTTLDQYFAPNFSPVDLLKIDIEGSEVRALKGMTEILRLNPRLKLVIEYNPRFLSLAGASGAELLDILASHGFVLYDIHGSEGTRVPVTKNYFLETYGTYPKPDHTNILAIHP